MKKLIVMVVLVCLSVVTFSAETNCAPADSDKTKQTTPAKDTKKEKKVKKQVQKKDDKNTKDTNKTSGTCKIK
jgi:Ni/Co efflux regulator RcnB